MKCPQCQYELRSPQQRCPRCGQPLCMDCSQCDGCRLKFFKTLRTEKAADRKKR